jgi:AcrR family transcriptional regulator
MRTTKTDWFEKGLEILGASGHTALTIDGLGGRLGVTKGSFYHHFANVRDFQEQLIAHWADQYLSTSDNLPDDPAERLALLDGIMREAFSPVTEPEIAIRTWAQQDEMVRSYAEQVDAVRREFVQNVFQGLAANGAQARLMADMLTALLIGSMAVLPRMSPERVLELYEEFKRLYGLRGER